MANGCFLMSIAHLRRTPVRVDAREQLGTAQEFFGRIGAEGFADRALPSDPADAKPE